MLAFWGRWCGGRQRSLGGADSTARSGRGLLGALSVVNTRDGSTAATPGHWRGAIQDVLLLLLILVVLILAVVCLILVLVQLVVL